MKIAVINQTVNLIKDDTLVEKSNKTYTAEFTFNEYWDGFTKTVRFKAGSVIQTAPLDNNRCVIPSECLKEGGAILMVRISGIKDISGEIDATDTFWRPLSRILYRYSFEPTKDTAIRSGELVEHTANFYTTEDMSGPPAFTLDFPEEMFLDQAETRFVDNFVWSAALYPGSTDPNLDGKPVFVLAVRGEDETDPTYSFLDMQTLVDTYGSAPGDGSASVTVSGYRISVNVNLSEEAGNILRKDSSGKLFAEHNGAAASDEEVEDMLDEIYGSGGD